MRRHPIARRTVLLVAVLVAGGASAAEEGSGDDAEYVGSAACRGCHPDVAAAFARTPHARSKGWDETRGCESCHGPGLAHVRSGGREGMANLSELASHDPDEASRTCIGCHEGSQLAGGSHHDLADVGCLDCHSGHGTEPRLLRAPEKDLCASCHQDVAARLALPRSHPPAPDGRTCTGCHSAHGSLLATASLGGDACADCHADKAGPFAFPHDVSMLDGCVACHEPHGSTNRHLLTFERQVELCYSCHPGSRTPTFHSFGRFTGEKCTACHTAIHGSNASPTFLEE